MVKLLKTLGVFVVLCVSLAGGTTSAAARADQTQNAAQSHHKKPVAHAKHAPLHRAHAPATHHVTATHVSRSATAHKVTRPAKQTAHRVVARPAEERVEAFMGRTRTAARVVSISRSRVVVRLPNGAMRTFVAFRADEPDRSTLRFRSRTGVERDFQVVRVSRFEDRLVVVTREIEVEPAPEVTLLRGYADADDEVMLVQPNEALVPFTVTTFQPLPNGQVALVANDQIAPVLVAPNVTFVGRVLNELGNLVTFGLANGTTRTLVLNGPMPAIGGDVVVVENGSQVVSLAPAVTNFLGQVVAVNNDLVTFELPNGATRTLLVPVPAPALGTRVVVYEDGERAARLQVVSTL